MTKTNQINKVQLAAVRNDLTPMLEIDWCSPSSFQESKISVRKATPKHLKRIEGSIRKLGFVQPILISGYECVDGQTRLKAALKLGLSKIPCVDVKHLSDDEVRLLRLSLNKLQEGGTWDEAALKLEFQYHLQMETDLSVTGFAAWEIDPVLEIGGPSTVWDAVDEFGDLPEADASAVSKPGDLWRLGDNSVLCGNARSLQDFKTLVVDRSVSLVFTDPPFNVPINGHVTSDIFHPEFHEASGEMTSEQFEEFLVSTLGSAASALGEGRLLYVFMDWRHKEELTGAFRRLNLTQIQLCVWAKEHPGMGSFYRFQYELICIAKKPGAPHINNVNLGTHGRNRSNVWQFPGATGGQTDEADDFKVHPTVKPFRLIEEALLDVTSACDFVLDPFLGSGSTLLAAERTQRRCLGLEISPAYVDVAIRRWQDMTGDAAIHVATEVTFADREMAACKSGDTTDQEDF